jgi:hypothetical protein
MTLQPAEGSFDDPAPSEDFEARAVLERFTTSTLSLERNSVTQWAKESPVYLPP